MNVLNLVKTLRLQFVASRFVECFHTFLLTVGEDPLELSLSKQKMALEQGKGRQGYLEGLKRKEAELKKQLERKSQIATEKLKNDEVRKKQEHENRRKLSQESSNGINKPEKLVLEKEEERKRQVDCENKEKQGNESSEVAKTRMEEQQHTQTKYKNITKETEKEIEKQTKSEPLDTFDNFLRENDLIQLKPALLEYGYNSVDLLRDLQLDKEAFDEMVKDVDIKSGYKFRLKRAISETSETNYEYFDSYIDETIGKYTIIKELGEGHFGKAFEVRKDGVDESFVLKKQKSTSKEATNNVLKVQALTREPFDAKAIIYIYPANCRKLPHLRRFQGAHTC